MKTLTRTQAIALLRTRCLELVDEEHSLCEVASRRHSLCGGFSQWKTGELRKRFDWIVRKRPGIRRRELEDVANRWQLARQFALDEPLACDAQARENHHPICGGWDGFSDEDLARFCAESTGEPHHVVADPVPPGDA